MITRKKCSPFLNGDHFKSSAVVDDDSLFYIQEHFLRMLALEQKRTERSNESFMLMLIDISRLLHRGFNPKTMKKLLNAIHSATRETDIKGWYNLNKTIGIIYTAVDNNFIEMIVKKMKGSVQKNLIPTQYSLVHVSYTIFPENRNKGKNTVINLNAA